MKVAPATLALLATLALSCTLYPKNAAADSPQASPTPPSLPASPQTPSASNVSSSPPPIEPLPVPTPPAPAQSTASPVPDPAQPTPIAEPPSPQLPAAPPPLKLTLDSLFLAPSSLLGQKTRSLTLHEALLEALENNPSLQARRLGPEIANANVQATLGRFDPTLSLSSRYNYSNIPQNAAQYIATGGTVTQAQLTLIDQLEEILAILRGQQRQQTPPNQRILREPNLYDTQNIFNRIALTGILPLGTTYEFYLSFDELRNPNNIRGLPALFYPEYSGAVGFRVTQPLLRNFGPAATLAATRIARLDRTASWLEWRAEVERVLAEVAIAYYDLALAQENLRVREHNIRLAQRLAADNQRRVLHGKMSQFDVLEAQSAVQNRLDEYYTSLSEFATRMATLRSLLTPPEQLSDWTELRPAESLPTSLQPVHRDLSLLHALQFNTQLQFAQTTTQKSDVIVRYRRNQLLPDLSLQLGVAGLSTASSYANSIDAAFEGQGLDFSAAVVLSIPLGNVESRAQLAAAKFEQQRARYLHQNVQLTVASQIDAFCSRLLIARERITSAQRAVQIAEQALLSANRLLEEGRATSFDVLRLQNNLAVARAQLNAAYADSAKNMILLRYYEGNLPESLGFSLEKEAWRHFSPTPPRQRNFRNSLQKKLPPPSSSTILLDSSSSDQKK